MNKKSILLQEEDKLKKGDLGSVGIGAAIAGPVGALVGLGANRLYKWARERYLNKNNNKQNNKKTQPPKNDDNQDDLATKIKNAQDKIKDNGIFEPELYQAHKFYKTTIYDKDHPEENNFVYISQKRDGAGAYKKFLEYWAQKYKDKKKNVAIPEIENFIKLVKERFKCETNKTCLITIPRYFAINNDEIYNMAKNSDIADKEKVIYYDKPSFDSNYAFDLHMYKNKNEAIKDDNIDEYKTSLILFEVYGRDYVYAFDLIPGGNDIHSETKAVMLELGQELIGNDEDDRLYAFSKILERMVYTEKENTNVYCVATPLLRKNSKNSKDLEYNATLLDGIGIYTSEEKFKQNYLEDYQKLLENQMDI